MREIDSANESRNKTPIMSPQVKIRESEMNALQKTEALERELEQVRLRERQTTIVGCLSSYDDTFFSSLSQLSHCNEFNPN